MPSNEQSGDVEAVQATNLADGAPIEVQSRLLPEEREQYQQTWMDYYRSREPTYYGAWRQPERSDVAQFRDEHQVFGLWFTYFYLILFLLILCIIIAIYYIIKYTS